MESIFRGRAVARKTTSSRTSNRRERRGQMAEGARHRTDGQRARRANSGGAEQLDTASIRNCPHVR